jgi:hypothetical protein
MARQAGAGGVAAQSLRVVKGSKQLANRSQVQRGVTAYRAYDLHARAFTVSALYIDNLIALAHAEVDGLLREFV